MSSSRTFPRLRASPNATNDSGRPSDLRTFAYDAAGYRSLPHTPRAHHSSLVPGPRSIWVAMRRDRQSRIHSILEARSARGAHIAMQQRQHPESVIETLSPKELPKAIRMRAREVAWMLGQRTKPKTVAMSGLANALRATPYDEDDVVADALAAAGRAGYVADGGEQSADFDTIQEIVSLRHTLRLLLRMQLEHPDPGVRKNVDDILARVNSAKKTLKVPVPQALASGPSFFFPAEKFKLAAQLRLTDGIGMDDDSFSSSSDEFSDYGDDDGGAGGIGTAANAAQRINASAVAAAAAAIQGGLLGNSDQEATRQAHLMWVRKYAEAMQGQWHNGAPHLFQLFNPLPQCGFALSSTLGNVFSVYRSSVKEPEAYYLFAAGAAQAGSYPLVCFAESRVMASCYDDDGDVYEEWMSRGLASAGPKTQLLAHFGQMLVSRPWLVSAQDVQRYVDEYVRLHTENPLHHLHRARGDSSNVLPSPRMPVHRSLSTSVVSGAAHSLPSLMNEFPRRSIEENAIRDLLHTVVVMAVAHGLSSFVSACGLTPDLDIPAGSYFPQFEGLIPAETGPGLAYEEPSPLLASFEPRQQPQISAAAVEQIERNTADLIDRLRQPAFADSYDSQPLSAGVSSFQAQQLMLRQIAGTESRTSAYIRSLGTIPDPLSSQAPQFAAYQHMRAQRLSRYELPSNDQQLPPPVPHINTAQYAGGEVPSSVNVSDVSAPATASPLEIAHSKALNLALLPRTAAERTPLFSFSQPQSATTQKPQPPRPVHLSQNEDLRWEVVSSYLRQQLSINEDHLGAEVQAARGLVGRPFSEALLEPEADDTANVYVPERCNAPVTSDSAKPEWERPTESMGNTSAAAAAMLPKSYSMTNVLSLANNSERNLLSNTGESQYRSYTNRAVDVRRFHDAIWHFTLSLFHIYEEYYFYNKFKDEITPDSSQMEIPADSALPMPVNSPDMADIGMDIDTDADMGDIPYHPSRSNSSQQFSRWLTDELKGHIRAVVRNPASITALTAQSPVATGLNLCVEEMLHINLIISLARRQAEIIHGIRAIREYEALAHHQ